MQAEARQLDLDELINLVQESQFPIVLVDRSILGEEFAIHAVVPVRFSRQYVTVLDPLRGERRISVKKFARAHRRVGRWTIAFDRES